MIGSGIPIVKLENEVLGRIEATGSEMDEEQEVYSKMAYMPSQSFEVENRARGSNARRCE